MSWYRVLEGIGYLFRMLECFVFIFRVRNRYGLKVGGRYCNYKVLWLLVIYFCVLMVRRGLGIVIKEKRDRVEDISKGCL